MEKKITTEDILQHHGVKGMKWGVRRYQPYQPGDGQKGKGKFLGKTRKKISDSRVGQEVRSRKREIDNLKKASLTPDMSTSDIRKANNRMNLENRMKELTNTKRARNTNIRQMQEKAKQDYRNRANMSDDELKRKVDRLQAIEDLNQNANKQGKTFIKLGENIANASSAMIVTAMTDETATLSDMVDLMSEPSKAMDKVYKKQLSQSGVTTDDILQHSNLKHHGVKGMKWGVRRYQPYPKVQDERVDS